MTPLFRIGLTTIAIFLLSACSPKQHQPMTTGISFVTQAPDYLLQQSDSNTPQKYAPGKTLNWLNHQYHIASRLAAGKNASYIAFYSDQQHDKPILTPAFSYVTAIISNRAESSKHDHNKASQQAILASNIDFGADQSAADVFAYNPNKARAEAFEQQQDSESIAYLSLIKQTHYEDDAPLAHDLMVLAHSVDRLATQGRNKIILLSQYDAKYNSQITDQIKGLDVIISAGKQSGVEVVNNSCLATFEQTGVNWQTLFVSFDSDGNILRCRF